MNTTFVEADVTHNDSIPLLSSISLAEIEKLTTSIISKSFTCTVLYVWKYALLLTMVVSFSPCKPKEIIYNNGNEHLLQSSSNKMCIYWRIQ